MKNPLKALEAIEALVGGDFGQDMEILLHLPKKRASSPERNEQDLKTAARIISEIYRISHCETNHSCRHKDWEDIKYKVLEEKIT